jgi:ribosomal protein S18 acetylase RimI-like enzyme
MQDTRHISRIDHSRDDQALAQTLANAFQDDPALAFIIPNPAKRRLVYPKLFTIFLKSDRKSGLVLGSSASETATLWREPFKTDVPVSEMIGEAIPILAALGFSLPRALALSDAIEARHPKEHDYWYLHFAGVSPRHQGKGWGGLAIREGLARAHAGGKRVLLETATPSNVPLYQRLGFTTMQEWDVPKGGPHFWTMIWEG